MTDDTASDIADEPAAYDVVESELVYRSGRVIDVRRDVVAMPGGGTTPRDVVQHPGAVGVIALDDEGRVLLLRQYRHPIGQLLWEPPAGLLDEPGEDPLEAAKRELFEEAHVRAQRWDVLLDAFTSPGLTSEAVRVYLARDVGPAEGPRHEGEHEEADMPVEWVPVDEAVSLILAGRLHNPMAVMGVLATAVAAQRGWTTLRPGDAPWPQMGSYRGSRAESA
jgi:8-oxo-dGTP pyrophosphatase MutT (NUDIX family)